MEEKKPLPAPKRVFINDVDKYTSGHIAKFLSSCITGEVSEDDDTEAQSSSSDEDTAKETLASFHIRGTVSPSSAVEFNFPVELYISPTREELLELLLDCDVIIYNTSENATQQQLDEATWAITTLHADLENFNSKKRFILVSTVMTWARTKPEDSEDGDGLLTEQEFWRRRSHLSFKKHNILEKVVLKLGRARKSKLVTYVVASGIQYGLGEHLLHPFFKASWLMTFPKIPIFGEGKNHIPMIHINDLAGVIQNIIKMRPRSRYILAVDDSMNTLEEIVKAISDNLGPGKMNYVSDQSEQEALTMILAFQPGELEYLSIDLRLDTFIIKDSLELEWTSETGMVENIEKIVKEYRDTRQLLPIRICLVGPPAVGKTTLAEKLCVHYKIHHIQIKALIEEKMEKLKETVNTIDSDEVTEEEVSEARAELDKLNESMEANDGRLEDELVIGLLQEKLNSRPCLNQGYVLDGFLKTYAQAKEIFKDEDTEEQDEKGKAPAYNKNITPEHVIALEATDEFLIKRVLGLPESVAEKMRYTHDEFLPRLRKYRKLRAADDTLLDYFDEMEIYPDRLEVTTDDPEYKALMIRITEIVGPPKNYGLSPEEQEEEDRKKAEEEIRKKAWEAAEKKRRNESALAEITTQWEEWQRNLAKVKKEEEELLEARSLPLRNYLMRHVMPSLSEAIAECCKIKPENPINFLAEHLLRRNKN